MRRNCKKVGATSIVADAASLAACMRCLSWIPITPWDVTSGCGA